MAHQCWTCGILNDSRKSLKNHAASVHRHLAVMCMYCYPKEKTLGRINDLKKHIQTRHSSVFSSLSSSFFTEGNGFYLSINPYDYVRHVKPTATDSSDAKQAMTAVRLLLPALQKPPRSMEFGSLSRMAVVPPRYSCDTISCPPLTCIQNL